MRLSKYIWPWLLYPALTATCSSGAYDIHDICPNGLRCPDGTRCVQRLNLCVVTSCGNGVVDIARGEACDPGDGETIDCDIDCTRPVCGDAIHNRAANEECDDGGQSAECDSDCSLASCGDGQWNPRAGEACDDGGNSDRCDGDCTLVSCGDGFANSEAGEACDTGGSSSTCDGDCSPVECGDGYTNVIGGEQCDDGGGSSDCDSDCTLPQCGDGTLNIEAGEECDDGNSIDSDDCLTICRQATCGDGIVHDSAEECDDGNLDSSDDCTEICQLASCEDGLLNADESDVDCGGHCGPTCAMTASCSSHSDCMSGFCVVGRCTAGRLSLGENHTCAAHSVGSVKCWGRAIDGVLGYGYSMESNVYIGDDELPSSMGDIDVGGTVVQIAAGSAHNCVLLSKGNVRCWGNGANGRLGYGNTENVGHADTPASAGDVNVGGPVVQLAAGAAHTCALLATGAVRCWGDNDDGQLGYGHTSDIGDDELPASAGDVDVGGTSVQVAAGGDTSCVILDTGAARCWGAGYDGQHGYGGHGSSGYDIGDDETPASMGDIDLAEPVVQIAAGGSHTCALLSTGNVRCWGFSDQGRLGYPGAKRGQLPSLTPDVYIGTPMIHVVADHDHTCGLSTAGELYCWGASGRTWIGYWIEYGQLGYGNHHSIGDNEHPHSAGPVSVGEAVLSIAVGRDHTCARLSADRLRCWGRNSFGQLGYGHTDHIGDDEVPSDAGDVPYL